MMAITVAAMETALGGQIGDPHVIRYFGAVSTFQEWLVHGNQTVAGRVRMIRTTASDNAATQAAAVLTALRA
jgi:hypothetical protein